MGVFLAVSFCYRKGKNGVSSKNLYCREGSTIDSRRTKESSALVILCTGNTISFGKDATVTSRTFTEW